MQIVLVSLQKCSPQFVPPNELMSFGKTLQYIIYQALTRTQIGVKKIFCIGIELGNAQNGTVDLGRFSLDNMESVTLYNGQK